MTPSTIPPPVRPARPRTTDDGRPLLLVAAASHGAAQYVLRMLGHGPLGHIEAEAVIRGQVRGIENQLAVHTHDPATVDRLAAVARPRLAVFVETPITTLARRDLAASFAGRPEMRAGSAARLPPGAVVEAFRRQSFLLAAVQRARIPVVVLHEVAILADPAGTAAQLARLLAPWRRLDAAAMARAALPLVPPDDRAAARLLGGF